MKKLIWSCVCLLFLSCGNTDMENNTLNFSDYTSRRVIKNCIEGKLYYWAQPGIANKLHDDGTPVKCKIINRIVVELKEEDK